MCTEATNAGLFRMAYRGAEPDRRPSAVVCVLTRRRPEPLSKTLASVAAQEIKQPFVCVVADNDPGEGQGAKVATWFFEAGRLQGSAVFVDMAGHCSASNGAFAAARALYPDVGFIAMIDDDEIAEPCWLNALIGAQNRTGADLVGGPVLSRFERTDAAAFAAHPVFKPFFAESGPVPSLYGSGNFLMRSSVLDRMGHPVFDPAFNFTGGGDFDFFLRCRDLGFKAYFEAGAVAIESVPKARTSTRWVLARSMRYGTINYMIEKKAAQTGLRALGVPAKSLCLLALAPIRAATRLVLSRSFLIASHPVMEAFGRLAAPFGLRPEQYRPNR